MLLFAVPQYLHTRAIIHRDIKPENILFASNSSCLKLADFGLAIDLREERAVTRAGTLDYMAPEASQRHIRDWAGWGWGSRGLLVIIVHAVTACVMP